MKHKSEFPPDPKELNPQIPDELSHMILKCLDKEKVRRYQSAGEVSEELDKIGQAVPTTTKEISKKKHFTSKEITVQFNQKKLFIPALIAVAVIITGFIIWKLIPEKEITFGPKIENSIAVISFENQTGDEAYDYLRKAIPNLLITSLEQEGHLYVSTWERLRDLLKQMGEDDMEFIDNDTGFSLCRREGIEAIVLGSFVKAGDVFATDVKVLNVETKKMIKSASSQGRHVDSILERQIGELSREISQSLGIQTQTFEPSSPKLADITTTSMEAFDFFLKGEEASTKLYYEDAQEFFERAVSLDPDFAMAWARLGNVYGILNDVKSRNRAVEKAMMLSERASEKEKQRITIDYASAIERDPEKYFGLLMHFVEKYPKEKWAYQRLGGYYRNRERDFAKAIDEYHKVLALDPEHGQALNMSAYCYMDLKDYQKAIEYFEKYAAVSPGESNPHDSMGEVFFRMGKIEEAILKYKRALQIKPDFFGSMKGLVYINALKQDYPEAMSILERWMDLALSPRDKREAYFCKGFYHFWFGNLEKCLMNLEMSQGLSREVGFEGGIAQANYLKSWIYYDWGEHGLSRQFNEKWFDYYMRTFPQNQAWHKAHHELIFGFIELKEGRIDSAKKRLIDTESMIPDMTDRQKENFASRFELLQAEVFLAEGFADKCIEIMREKSPRFPGFLENAAAIITYNAPFRTDVLPRAYLRKGDLDNAISAYEELIEFDPEGPERYLINPIYYYRLAKVYEEKGWGGKAIEHYEKFLDLWKDADPGLPEVKDARERVAGLR
jgi:tetratricopeptide (TPR) repeat protein